MMSRIILPAHAATVVVAIIGWLIGIPGYAHIVTLIRKVVIAQNDSPMPKLR